MGNAADSKTPVIIALLCVAAGIVIAAMRGSILYGSIGGGILAAAGAIPACFGMWKGIQQENQGPLAMAVGSVILALGVGGVLIVLGIINIIRH